MLRLISISVDSEGTSRALLAEDLRVQVCTSHIAWTWHSTPGRALAGHAGIRMGCHQPRGGLPDRGAAGAPAVVLGRRATWRQQAGVWPACAAAPWRAAARRGQDCPPLLLPH